MYVLQIRIPDSRVCVSLSSIVLYIVPTQPQHALKNPPLPSAMFPSLNPTPHHQQYTPRTELDWGPAASRGGRSGPRASISFMQTSVDLPCPVFNRNQPATGAGVEDGIKANSERRKARREEKKGSSVPLYEEVYPEVDKVVDQAVSRGDKTRPGPETETRASGAGREVTGMAE